MGLRTRVNPADEPGEYGAIAAAGTSVYVAYLASDHDADDYDPDAPRQVRVRVNTDHGSSTAWLANKTLNATGRARIPAAAAAGAYGYVAFTDWIAATSWLRRTTARTPKTTAGSRRRSGHAFVADEDGYEGGPVIAAAGSLVLVAWIADDGGTLKTKISTDHGVTWPDTALTLARSSSHGVSVAALGDRLAVAWTTSSASGCVSSTRAGVRRGASPPSARRETTGSAGRGRGSRRHVARRGRLVCVHAEGPASRHRRKASTSAGGSQGRTGPRGGTRSRSPPTAHPRSAGSTTAPSVVMVGERKRLVAYNTASANYSTYRTSSSWASASLSGTRPAAPGARLRCDGLVGSL